jgi:predicted transposase YbfD/YdcC
MTTRLSEWPGICCLVRVERCTDVFNPERQRWTRREQTAWSISTRDLTAEQANTTVRGHWAIENALHHVRDVAFGEDASRNRKQPGIFARLRSWALNLIRL